ncbi:MAG: hypothetical protein IPP51_15295 [Bacteroidetes bacterium]|nr:hypothetical protein [Bacteroidota bacterium]
MRILKCLDGLGRTVFFRSISTDESQITLDLSNLIPAVYYIQIESTDNTVTLPFVKM